ncbi:MAG: PDZ domain-containing protein [Gemmatimonadales bacterium]|nr:MAG: PDZ domain-containing protein [Gemmatimonadales bacterium]
MGFSISRLLPLPTPLVVALALLAAGCSVESAPEAAPANGPPEVADPSPDRSGPSPLHAAEAARDLDDDRVTAIVRASERVSPAVVAIHVLRTRQVRVRDPFFDDFFGGFFGGSRTQLQQVPSLGSGFVLDDGGWVLTNEHVVRGAERVLVTLPDGRDLDAELVGADPATDVAVLRLSDPEGVPVAPVGSSRDLRIGEWVIAFGNPFGSLISNPEPTVTTGVVSALGRHIVPSADERGFYLGMIQTDAAINPGNSGGPLVNALGEVVGMNASIFTRSGGSEGLGFAIPIERVLQIAEDLIRHDRVRRAWVGVDVEPVDADEFGRTRGVRVGRVVSDSPAGRAGISRGDRLVELNGTRLVTPLDFEAVLLDLRAGDDVVLRVDGRDDPVRLEAMEAPSVTAERITVLRDLEVATLTDAIREERGIRSEVGVLVTGVTGQARQTLGLTEGDVIVGINNTQVATAPDLVSVVEAIPSGARVRIIFERNRGLVARDFVLGR